MFYVKRSEIGSHAISNIPDYIQREYPLFLRLMIHFFDFMESEDGGKILRDFNNLREDHNVISPYNRFWDTIYADGAFPFNKDLRIDQRQFFNYLMDFYMFRGSIRGLKFIISVLYDEECEVSHPRDLMLIPSQAHYSNNQYMCVKLVNKLPVTLEKELSDSVSNYSLVVKSVSTGFSLDVENVQYHLYNGNIYLILKVKYLFTNKYKPSEQLKLVNDSGLEILCINTPLIKINIKESGYGYKEGEFIRIDGTINKGSVIVKEITSGGIDELNIISRGSGYKVGESIFAEPTVDGIGGGFYGEITEVDPNGAIVKVKVFSNGRGYRKIPRINIGSNTGKNASIEAKSKSIGGIKKIDYLYNYIIDTIDQNENNLKVSVETKNGTGAVLEPELVVINDTSNMFFTHTGFISNTSYLTDSLYYQQFSYKIDASIPRYIYDKAVDILSHPVGYIRYSQFNLCNYYIDYNKTNKSAFYVYRYKTPNDKNPTVDKDGTDTVFDLNKDGIKPIFDKPNYDPDDTNKLGKWSIKETLRNRMFLAPELTKVLGAKFNDIIYWQSENHLLDTFIYLQKDIYDVVSFPATMDYSKILYVFNEKRAQTIRIMDYHQDTANNKNTLIFRNKQPIVTGEIYKVYDDNEKEVGKVLFNTNRFEETFYDNADRKKNLITLNGEGRIEIIVNSALTPDEEDAMNEMFGEQMWFTKIV